MTSHTSSPQTAPTSMARSPWKSVGMWLAVGMVLYTFSNVARSALDPLGFADFFFGQQLTTDNTAFVGVYAVRTLFLGLFGAVLILQRNVSALTTFSLVAIVMPLGDAAIASAAGAPFGRVAAHLLIAGILFVTWALLKRWLTRFGTKAVAL